VVNTIPRAKAICDAVKREQARAAAGPAPILVHSHFRAADRKTLVDAILSPTPSEGRILISTQVVEAGVDISARVLFTELAPWGSMVQRLGRCNRYGEAADAEAYWFDVDDKVSAPYSPEELAQSRDNLADLSGAAGAAQASPEALAGSPISRPRPTQVLRAPDLIGLFDTTPDLSGFDVDVSRFVRDSQDHDVQVFWRTWDGDWPPEEMEGPHDGECCPAPIGDVRDMLAKPRAFWRWDQLVGRWVKANARDIYPGQTLLLDATGGGYSPETGWEPASREPVEEARPAPVAGGKDTEKPQSESAKQAAGQASFGSDRNSIAARRWVSIVEHTDVTVETVHAIVKELAAPLLSPELARALLRAARWHDRGKAHPEFQATLFWNVPDADRAKHAVTLWAKSPSGRTKHARRYLRHELASAMAYLGHVNGRDSQLPETSDGVFLSDLVAYLIGAHHGRVRLSIRSMPREESPRNGATIRYAMGIREGESLPATDLGGGETAEKTTINLSVMEIGTGAGETASWLERTTGLRDSRELGPFRLAFLEAILRAADSRASIQHEKGGANGG
jgi:CRISPR-associated endonuclease/helicase Cas3